MLVIFVYLEHPEKHLEIVVNVSSTFQHIFGYGGAFTDAAGINLNSLSEGARIQLLKAYFDTKDGMFF